MKAVSAFRTRIAGRVPGVLDPVIDIAVLDTCIDFCEKTLVIRGMLDSFLTTASVREYDLQASSPLSVAKVIRVWCDDMELSPVDDDELAGPYGFVSSIPGQTATTSAPRLFGQPEPGLIAMYPIPDRAYTINARVALRPTRTATSVSDALFEDWAEAITHGACVRIMTQPGEFMNPKLADFHRQSYMAEINRAMLQARRGSIRAESRVRPVHI